jgi:hypothetical protein
MGFKGATLSIPFKVLTNKANPVDFSKNRGKCSGRKGEGCPELMAKRLILIDISIGLLQHL